MDGAVDGLTDADLGGMLHGEVLGRRRLGYESGSAQLESVLWRADGHRPDTIRRGFLKHGRGDGIARERLRYAAYLDAGEDPVPRLVAEAGFPGGSHAFVLEWVDGHPPDFESPADVAIVFHRLGAWGARWCGRLQPNGGEVRTAARREVPGDLVDAAAAFASGIPTADSLGERLAGHVAGCLRYPRAMAAGGGPDLGRALLRLNDSMCAEIAATISALPWTLHNGDLSLHNTLVGPRRDVYFFDFEDAEITWPAVVLDVLGEPWGSIPEGHLVDIALRSYGAGWNTGEGAPPLDLASLRRAQRSAHLMWAVDELDGWIARLEAGDREPDLPGWVRRGTRDLGAHLRALGAR